jgi:hypothetical protein
VTRLYSRCNVCVSNPLLIQLRGLKTHRPPTTRDTTKGWVCEAELFLAYNRGGWGAGGGLVGGGGRRGGSGSAWLGGWGGGGGGCACGSDFLGSRNPEEARLVLKLRARAARWLAAPSGRELALDRRQAVGSRGRTQKRTAGGALTNAKSARRATSSSPSPLVRQGWGAGTATHDAGGLPQGSSYFLGQPWLRPRGPKDAATTRKSAHYTKRHAPQCPPKTVVSTPLHLPLSTRLDEILWA